MNLNCQKKTVQKKTQYSKMTILLGKPTFIIISSKKFHILTFFLQKNLFR